MEARCRGVTEVLLLSCSFLFIILTELLTCLPFSTLVGGDKADKCMKRGGGKRPFFFWCLPGCRSADKSKLKIWPQILCCYFLVYLCSTNKVIIMIKDGDWGYYWLAITSLGNILTAQEQKANLSPILPFSLWHDSTFIVKQYNIEIIKTSKFIFCWYCTEQTCEVLRLSHGCMRMFYAHSLAFICHLLTSK